MFISVHTLTHPVTVVRPSNNNLTFSKQRRGEGGRRRNNPGINFLSSLLAACQLGKYHACYIKAVSVGQPLLLEG